MIQQSSELESELDKVHQAQRAEAMALCVSLLASTLPVPLKGKLEMLCEDPFDWGLPFTLHINIRHTSDNDDDKTSDEDTDGSNAAMM
jgi:hypothetical protein